MRHLQLRIAPRILASRPLGETLGFRPTSNLVPVASPCRRLETSTPWPSPSSRLPNDSTPTPPRRRTRPRDHLLASIAHAYAWLRARLATLAPSSLLSHRPPPPVGDNLRYRSPLEPLHTNSRAHLLRSPTALGAASMTSSKSSRRPRLASRPLFLGSRPFSPWTASVGAPTQPTRPDPRSVAQPLFSHPIHFPMITNTN